jgi:hypothetical protein
MRGGDEQIGELFSYVRRVLANCLEGQMKRSTAYFLSHARSNWDHFIQVCASSHRVRPDDGSRVNDTCFAPARLNPWGH